MRVDTPISTNQAVRAFRRLSEKDAEYIEKAAQRITERTGLKMTEAFQLLASIGRYMVEHGE